MKLTNNNSNNINSKIITNNKDNEAKAIILEGVGYPFNFSLMDGNVEINDAVLFEQYAKDQWEGMTVTTGSYLFDQKILPDFAFKVVAAHPDNSIIGNNTSIVLVDDEKEDFTNFKAVDTNFSLNDVVGQVNAKNKSKVIMKYLEDPEKFGNWAPRNILFYGLPGTGKTMLAKALSTELNVPLYLIKATSLIGDHVGDGAYKIHELFEIAQKSAPSIIFIDEMDAIALDRSFQSLRGDVSEVVNALLTEMDGIDSNKGVITIGATNNVNTLDYAIRSRFEEEIEFTIPTDKERKEIINNNLKTYPLDMDVSVNKLVKLSEGMSGRDIKEKLLKTSLHNAISNDKDIVDLNDINYALKVLKRNQNDEVKNMFI